MKKIAGGIAVAVLLALCWTGVVYGASKEGKGLSGRITDAILGDKNVPGVLVPILENEEATAALAYEIAGTVADKMVGVTFDKIIYKWQPRELPKDARAIRFEDRSVVDFKMKEAASVSRFNFFQRYKDDLKLSDNDQMYELRVSDNVVETSNGSKTYTNSRFGQKYKGVPVWGAQVALEELGGRVISGNGRIAEGIDLDVTPTITQDVALSVALSDINAEAYSWQSSDCTGTPNCIPDSNPAVVGWYCMENVTGSCMPVEGQGEYFWYCVGDIGDPGTGEAGDAIAGYCDQPEGELGIVSEDVAMKSGNYHLAWVFRIYTATPWGVHNVLIDAHTGEVLANEDPVLGDLPAALDGFPVSVGQCTGVTQYNGVQDFIASHIITDDSFSTDLYALYLERNESISRPEFLLHSGTGFIIPLQMDEYYFTPDMGYCSFEAEDTLGSSVWWALMKTYDYYKDHFSWNGHDGKGNRRIRAMIHYAIPMLANFMPSFPITDTEELGVLMFGQTSGNPPVWGVSLRDVSHEYTHAINHAMVYTFMGVSRSQEYYAIQEGLATVMEEVINAGVTGEPITSPRFLDPKSIGFPDTYNGANWPLVNMSGPLQIPPTCNSSDNWCYKMAAILVRWFHLMTAGGSGINDNGYAYDIFGLGDTVEGRDKVAKILLLAVDDSLNAFDEYLDMREHTIAAAKKLYPEEPSVSTMVQNAWAAVGLGSAHDTIYHSPKNGDPDVPAWPVRFSWEGPVGVQQHLLVTTDADFEKAYIISSFDETPLLSNANGISNQMVKRSVELNLKAFQTYWWVVVTDEDFEDPDTPFVLGAYESFMGWLKSIVNFSGDDGMLADSNYVDVPSSLHRAQYPHLRYFTTSRMKAHPTDPRNLQKNVHPWQTNFVIGGDVAGAEHIWVDITDVDTGEFQRVISPASEVFDDINNVHMLTADLQVDHQYEFTAMAQGPSLDGAGPFQPNLGKESIPVRFSTGKPKVVLEEPGEGAVVQPDAYFQWTELPGIGEGLNNGAYYRLIISESPVLSDDPVVVLDELLRGQQTVSLPPTNSGGLPAEYYWSVLPVGPSKYGEEGALAQPVHFTVDASATKPVTKEPGGQVAYNSPLEFIWLPVPGASGYQARLYDANKIEIWSKTVTVDALTSYGDGAVGFEVANVLNLFQDLGVHYWDVRGIFNGNPGLPSDMVGFRMGVHPPDVITPKDNFAYTKSSSQALLFAWDAVYAPHGYNLQIFEGDACVDGQAIEAAVIPDGNTKTYPGLEGASEGYYAWRIYIFGTDGEIVGASSCNAFRLLIDEDADKVDQETCTAPPSPILLSPQIIPFDTVLTWYTPVEWTVSPGADHYRVIIYKQDLNGGNFSEKCQYLTDTTYTMPVQNCTHELIATYFIHIYAESDSCYYVNDPIVFAYWVN